MPDLKILVTGCPRSGTRFVSRELLDAGVVARHERMGRDGIVSGLFCVDDYFYAIDRLTIPRFRDCKFEHVYHLVRDPGEVIPSMVTNLRDNFWHWQEKHTGILGDTEPAELKAGLFWLVWNGIVEENLPQARRIRIEDWASEWPKMANALGVEAKEIRSGDRFKTEHPRLDWEQITDDEVRASVQEMAHRYGYTED